MKKIKPDFIFISIASYRDPECIPTIHSIIRKAVSPEKLRIYVYEQNGPNNLSAKTIIPEYPEVQLTVETVCHTKAKGPNWARYVIQQHWDGEQYYLQIDSHTRFISSWDLKLKNMLLRLPDKSVLTQYPPEYSLEDDSLPIKQLRSGLYVEAFQHDFLTRIQSEYHKEPTAKFPFKSEAWGGCFSFSDYRMILDAPYDPYQQFLFFGEELDITLRLFTKGWYFYSPNENVVFTNFQRGHRNTYWLDQTTNKRHELELLSRIRLFYKFGMTKNIQDLGIDNVEKEFPELIKDLDKYTPGNIRTLKDYEHFAGVDFEERKLTGHNLERILKINRPKQLHLNGIKWYQLIF